MSTELCVTCWEMREELKKVLPDPYADYLHAMYRAASELMLELAPVEHTLVPRTEQDDCWYDWLRCTCGWESRHYDDGWDFAYDDYYRHIHDDVFELKPLKCPCGAMYIPGEGGKPCHELVPISMNRWEAFTDKEVSTILIEMTMDDGIVYGFDPDDEPGYTLWRELTAEVERRGLLGAAT